MKLITIRLLNNANKLEFNDEELWEYEQSVVGCGSMNFVLDCIVLNLYLFLC